MRALTGAIITAGAMIGLGLTAIGFGNRYASLFLKDTNGEYVKLLMRQMDTSLVVILFTLLAMLFVGVALTFLGLAYHHERRHREHLHRERSYQPVSSN